MTHTPSQEGIGVCWLETRDLGVGETGDGKAKAGSVTLTVVWTGDRVVVMECIGSVKWTMVVGGLVV